MGRSLLVSLALLGVVGGAIRADESDDWPCWRGPTRDGIAKDHPKLVTKWSETENILWKAEIPGKGHGSPIVVGSRVILATADGSSQSLLAFDRKTGKLLWKHVAHDGGVEVKGNAKSSQASSTPSCDGKRIFINFLNAGAIWTTAVDLEGKRLWQTKITDYTLHQGFGSSPMVYGNLLLVSADNKGTGVIAGLDRESGKIVWTHPRPKLPNYTSPIVIRLGGKDQIIMTGCDLVTSLEPTTGKVLWETKGATTECVTSTITDGQRVFTSGGYPKNHIAAIMADGSGKVAWENTTRVYVPSMLIRDGHLYAVMDDGFAVCWASDSGKQLWKERLGGTFSASPVMFGNKILATNEAGKSYLFTVSPSGMNLIATNSLGEEQFASPTIAGGEIYLRTARKVEGRRVETLYCAGKAD